jgi:serine/threonine-protein kinase
VTGDPESERHVTPAPVDLADGVLCALILAEATAARVEPAPEGGAAVTVVAGGHALRLALPGEVGEAVAARLALLAGLDPWAAEPSAARLPVRVGEARGEVAVLLEPGPRGVALELRRLPPAVATHLPETSSSAPGRIGPYVVESELGRGAMGIVYRARREGQGTPVAVKLLNPSIASDPGMAARFVREGQAAALVSFPGVVGVTDFGHLPDGQAYLVMEMVEGRTLEQELEKTDALTPDEALRIAIHILRALEAAHQRGVVHRDLKPSNVFLTPGGQVKIVDFGAALVSHARRSGRTDAGLVLGSPAYMAPEQALGRATDDRADLYSLGCVLYRMLSGRPPFEAKTLVEVLRLQIEVAPEPVRSPHGALPVLLVEAVERALAKDPEERFASAGEMRAVLEQALARVDPERRTARR